MHNVTLFDKITAVLAGGILIIFILTIMIYRIKYDWKREELDEYWKKCKDDDMFKTNDDKEVVEVSKKS